VWSDHDTQPRTSSESVRHVTSIEDAVISDIEPYSSEEPAASALSELFRQKKQPLPRTSLTSRARDSKVDGGSPSQHGVNVVDVERGDVTETTPLLAGEGYSDQGRGAFKGISKGQQLWIPSKSAYFKLRDGLSTLWHHVKHPELWDLNVALQVSLGAVSAVLLGLLLNVLDALSYGKISTLFLLFTNF
jgi:hypothetical protein